MDSVIGNLARAVSKLAKLGVERAVISADHGHLFASDRDESMRIDAPGGDTVDLHRRCWVGRGGTTPAGCVRVAAAALGYASDLDLIIPIGCGVFKAGGDLAFHHGGPSLQEMVVPVLTVATKAKLSERPSTFYLPGWEIPKMRNDLFTDHYGFVVDYLAEALREMRKHNFTEVIDRHFSLGAHLNARDRKAVRKTVSGMMKILFPHAEVTRDELAEILEFAIEGRRRVKEQLKKMGSFEYYHTSFSYTLQETGAEKFVGVPEQGGRDLISTDPLSPGTVYTAGVTSDGTVGLYRLEVSISTGTGKLKLAGGVSGPMRESIQRAFSYIQAKKGDLGIARDVDNSDVHVEVIDLLGNRVEAEVGVAFFVACYSAFRKAPVTPALLVLGDMSIQGNIKPLRSLTEPLQVAKDNGAKRALIPIENKRNFLDVSADIMEQVDPISSGIPRPPP